MSDPELPPALSTDLAALLDAERARDGAPSPARARLSSRLTHAIPGFDGPGGNDGGGDSGDPGIHGPSGGGAAPGAAGAAGAGAAGAAGSLGTSVVVGVGALGLVLGGALGVAADRSFFAPAPRTIVVEKRVEVPLPPVSAPPPVAPPSETQRPISPEDLTSAPRAIASSPVAPPSVRVVGRDSELANERAALEMARTALARGDSASALAAAERHRERFPRGQLAEEREAIAVQALASLGRAPEARARAARFKQAHPESILLPAVEEAASGTAK